MASRSQRPSLGCGVGLRPKHYPAITSEWPKVDWFEAVTENYMDSGGRPVAILEKIRGHYPIGLHGVALSIGSMDPLNQNYLERLKTLVDRIQPEIVSDHLCWSGAGGEHLHDLLPLPFTEEAVQHIVSRVQVVQDLLKRPILLENVSAYVTFEYAEMTEWEFLTEVACRSGCGILLDLNNIYVNAHNHGFDASEYVESIPSEKVQQFHLAGHTDMGKFLFDTHSAPVIEPVWGLYRKALKRFGQVTTLLEWDENIPDWAGLEAECRRAREIYQTFADTEPQTEPLLKTKRTSSEKKSGQSLREIQQMIKSYIQPAGAKNPGLRLNPQGGDPGVDRMSVYAGGYTARMYESLSEVYETLKEVMGEESFMRLTEMYAKRYPSHDYNLTHAGRHLPKMLKSEKPFSKEEGFLADLAKFEWEVSEAFHAFEKPPFEASQLAQIGAEDWENLRILFQPSVRLFQSPWAVLKLWEKRGQAKPPMDEIRQPQKILIGRKGTQVRCEVLEDLQQELLAGLLKGKTLGSVCEELAEKAAELELPIAQWFSGWVQDGLIASCELTSHAADV